MFKSHIFKDQHANLMLNNSYISYPRTYNKFALFRSAPIRDSITDKNDK